MNDDSRLTAGVRYRYNRLDFSGSNPFASSDLDLHRVQIPVNFWHSFHEQWKLWAGLDPGLFTDFSGLSDDDFAVTALAVVAYEFAPQWSVSFGGYYSRDLGEDRLLPVLGVIWRPNPHWNVSATFPRLRVAYAPNPNWVFEAMVRPGGSGWNYRNDAAGEQLDLEYKSWRATLGVEHFLTDNLPGRLFGYLEGGVGFSQSLKLKRDNDELASSSLGETLTLSAGLRWRF
jgi:outer membrane receptor protein involved in Fe transport